MCARSPDCAAAPRIGGHGGARPAGAASAGSLTKRDRGGVSNALTKRLHLTAQERRALDIASVQVTGRKDFGVVVDVRFKGNVERLIGRGHLKRAAIALVLQPRSRRVKSTVIVTQGPARSQRVRRRTHSKRAGAVRTGRSVKFFIQGAGFAGVKAVNVRTIPRAPRAAKRAFAAGEANDGVEEMTDAEVEEIEDGVVAADAPRHPRRQAIDPDDFDCAELEDLGDDLEAAIGRARALDDALGEVEDAHAEELPGARVATVHSSKRHCGRFAPLGLCSWPRSRSCRTCSKRWTPSSKRSAVLRRRCLRARGVDRQFFGPGEVARRCVLPEAGAARAERASPITSIRVVLPPDGSTNRQVTNFLCPSQLPNGGIETTNAPNDTLVCSGGSLALDERFRVNVRMNPAPTSGMGGQLFGQQDGSFKGPFAITGP